MTKEQVEEAARQAGLKNPRLIVKRQSSAALVWKLHHGPDTSRKTIQLAPNPDQADATELIRRAVEAAA